jgi:hypothetical protein
MKIKVFVAALMLPVVLTACGSNSATNTVSVEPELNKYGKLGSGGVDTLPAVTRFGYNDANKADWINAYAGCAAAAGAKGNIDVLVGEYSTAKTVDLAASNNLTDGQRLRAFNCMSNFSKANSYLFVR